MTLASFIERSRREPEDWKYTDLDKLLARTPCEAVAPVRCRKGKKSDRAKLVFVNGVWKPELSSFGTAPSCLLLGDLESGYALTLGEQTCLVTQPIELVFISDEDAPGEIALKFSVDVGKNGRLTLLENYLSTVPATTVETQVALQEHSKFVHGKIVRGGVHLASHDIHAAAGSFYSNFSLIRGGCPARNEIGVSLDGEEAQASIDGVMLLRGKDHADTTAKVSHNAPMGTSRQSYRTVLDDGARGVFKGRIHVAPGAQKSDGYQLSRALLLSDRAEMDAKPELEIYADDVKCSHGSAIGDLDENAMFYLRSRGLSEEQARGLLIEGFVSEMLESVRVPLWRDVFAKEIKAWTS
ncbi:MAG: Fe-S cluster assembly protein SufD [Alphaproteobacteria bacterium]|nr:Fe-S cluster assembly protein SufD [Alphaproteobacteria bacterium]